MNKPTSKTFRLKAASAALAFISLSSWGAVPPTQPPYLPEPIFTADYLTLPAPATLPAEPDAAAAYREIADAMRRRSADTPLLMEKFLTDFPTSVLTPEVTLMLADWYFYSGEYSLALSYYRRLATDSFSGDTREGMLYRKAYALVKTGYYHEARTLFRSLAYSGKFGPDARFYLAYLDYVDGRYDEAYEAFKRVQGAASKGAEAEYYINQIDFLRGDYNKVARASDRLLVGDIPDVLKAETMRVSGLSYFKLGDMASARNILSRYAELAGDGAELSALYSLATIYYDEGNYEKALPLFTEVTAYPGQLAQSAWLYIGQIYMKRGDSQAAALAFDKAAKESWSPDVAETAAYNLAVSSASGPSLPFSDTAMAMESFIETYPSSPYAASLSNYLANAYYSRHDYEGALRQVDKISNPDAETRLMRQKILYQLGVSQFQQGKVTPAIQSLSEASASSAPDREVAAQASLWLGDAYYIRKEYANAAKAYEAAISSGRLGDNKALASYNLGYSYLKLRNYSKAAAAFKEATALRGLTPQQTTDARLRYADCLYYTGNYSEALDIFRNIKIGGGPDGVFAAIREADILGRNGKVNEKISILEGLVSNPDAGIWQSTVLSRLADAYSEKGDDRKAAELYARMLDNPSGGGDSSQTYYSLATNAENLYNAGDYASALAAYRRIETSGIDALYPGAVLGIIRTSKDPDEIARYAEKAASLSGLTADEMNEVRFLGAQAGAALGGARRQQALATLASLAASSDRLWGARAAVMLGEQLLADGDAKGAEETLLSLIDSGSDDNYWMARGYIALSDAYAAQGNQSLARLYLETLRDNYPGKEKDIHDLITRRLNNL